MLGFDGAAIHQCLPVQAKTQDAKAKVVVLDDNGRFLHESDSNWPSALKKAGPWVVWKVSRPKRQSDLAKLLTEKHASKLISVITIDDLRAAGLDLSKSLSWEATAQSVVRQLTTHFGVSDLIHSRYLIVVVPRIGAILAERGESRVIDARTAKFTLFYDPTQIESTLPKRLPSMATRPTW